jgi:hypothetical protein
MLILAVACPPLLATAGGPSGEPERQAILAALRAYVAALYARDYAEAYRWIAAADRRLKSQAEYEQDHEPFTGASLTLAKRLAREIVLRHAAIELEDGRATVRATLVLPNGNAQEVSALLLAEDGTAEAPANQLEERLAKLEALIANGTIPTVEVEDAWTLVRDPEGWRIFLDWARGVRLHFATHVPKGLPVTASFDRAEALTLRGDTLHLRLTVRNHGPEVLRLKVIHRVEPAALAGQLELVQCGYLLPRDIAAGEADQSSVVYFVGEDLPGDVSQVRVTLEFVALE